MQVRADFNLKALVRPGDAGWVASPQPGVDRLMLDRIGGEIARATSLVRFGPSSFFPHHVHGGGEEFFVIEGELNDENGSYPAGTYLRDPIGSEHTPCTKAGCIIFVKLWQFSAGDTTRLVVETTFQSWENRSKGVTVQNLHEFAGVLTFLLRIEPGQKFDRELHSEGEETFVLKGSFGDDAGFYPARTWMRDPGGASQRCYTDEGCTLFVKRGHLPKGSQWTPPLQAASA
jgi:anti-sigma factor ChrR (cupin superfamily)